MWLYMHAPKPQRPKGKELPAPKKTLQKKTAEFKAIVMQVIIFYVEESDEHLFEACRSPENRLQPLAIDNKHACMH